MMKKFMTVLVSLGFALGTLGCGGSQAKTSDEKSAPAAQEKPAKKSLKKAKGNRMEIAEEDE